MNPYQPKLIKVAIDKLPGSGRVIAAVDNDDAGKAIAAALEQIFKDVDRSDLDFQIHAPKPVGADWNDILKTNPGLFSYGPAQP